MDPDDIIVALDISTGENDATVLSDPMPASPSLTPWSYPLDDSYSPSQDDRHNHSTIHGGVEPDDSLQIPYRYVTSEDRDRERRSREYEHSIDEDGSLDDPNYDYQNNNPYQDDFLYPTIPLVDIQPNQVPPNTLNPRQQEEADQPVREGMRYLFDNKFMRARIIFQTKASSDPLYSLGLGAMAFIRAIMTHRETETTNAIQALHTTYAIAQAQIVNTGKKRKPKMTSFTRYFGDRINSTTNTIDPLTADNNNSSHQSATDRPVFLDNSILRAHVVKAEASLLVAILQLTRASFVGYIKSGFHLRRAYYSYNLVWQEYKRMGQDFTKHMDRDTVSGIQFGIGAVQLILSSLPSKMVQINSILGWSFDKELGFVLLKLCTEARGIRSSLSSLVLLAYYNILTSFAPQLYTKTLMEPALACLTDAQHQHPRSCFFLFFAARFARCAQNLALSSQSFQFAAQASRGEWAEQAMRQLTDHEQAFNDALQLNWEDSLTTFETLGKEGYWSPAFSKYMVGACYEMLGRRTEAILAFAEVPQCIERTMAMAEAGTHPSEDSTQQQQHHQSSTQGILYVDTFIQKKVKRYQQGGYQHMDLHLPALEMLLVWNMFEWMEKDGLTHCLTLVQQTLDLVYERERLEYGVRQKELVPSTAPPHYYDKRAGLLLIKAAVLNALRRSQETVACLNWILDHQRYLKSDSWMVPFTYWESGVTCWHLGQLVKSRRLWQQALSFTDYDFEHRMTIRLGLALNKCDEMNIRHDETGAAATRYITKGGLARKNKGPTSSNGRKRMPLA